MRTKRGRRSIASQMTPNIQGVPSRIVAPSTVRGHARVLWNELVDSCAADHFRPSDIPILQSYISATLIARAAATGKTKDFAVFEKAARLQKSLATSLRLAPSTRSDPKTIARQNPQRGQQQSLEPWDDEEKPYSRDEIGDDEGDYAQ